MKRIGAATVAAGVVVAVVVTLAWGGSGAGPFHNWQSDGGYNSIGAGVRSGQVLATTLVLPKTLSTPATLVSVRPLHPNDARGVKLQYGATIGNGLSVGVFRGWTPRAWQMNPLPGFVVPAHRRGGVVIGASSSRPGVHWIRGFVIDYKVGGTTYSAPQQFAMEVCVGKSLSCPSG